MNILHLKSIDSTNNYAKKHIKDLSLPLIVISDKQRMGRGRMGRRFISPLGGLYMTYVDRIKSDLLSMIVPLAVTETLSQSGIQTKILWPNDIIMNRRKLGGILIERIDDISIIGIGLNINSKPSDFPHNLRDKITTLFYETGKAFEIMDIATAIVENILLFLSRTEFVYSLYTERMYGKGKEFTAIIGRDKKRGIIRGVSENGELLFETEGEIITLSSATIR